MRLEEDKESFTCDYCRNVFFPEKNEDGVRVLDQDPARACPVCAVPLFHAALCGWRLHYCTRCRGLLIRMSVFVSLLQDLRAQHDGPSVVPSSADPQGLKRHLSCPQCHQPMDTHYYAGPGNVIIDDCSRCYLNWLDTGELQRIARAPDRIYAEDVYNEPQT